MNMKMWKRIAMGVAAAFVFGIGAMSVMQTTTYAAPAATIGFVDMQQVVNNSKDYKDAQNTLTAEADAMQKEFDTKIGDLSDDQKKQLFTQYQQRLDLKRQEVLGKVKEKVDAAIKDVATKQGISVVLDQNSVLYGGKDLTQDVINKLK